MTTPTSDDPPAYRPRASSSASGSVKRVQDMTPEERLASLKEWAEEQKYVRPGEGGTLGTGSIGGMNSIVYGGPVRYRQPSYSGWIAPPSYDTAQAGQAEKKPGALKRWLQKRKESREAERSESSASNNAR